MAKRKHYFDSVSTLERDGLTYKRYFYDLDVTPWDTNVDIVDQDGINVLLSSMADADQAFINELIAELREEACAMFEIYHREKRLV